MVQKVTHILIGIALSLFAVSSVCAQTFELNNNGNNPNSTKKNKNSKTAEPQPQTSQNGLGWGSSIETARNSRAAQQALEKAIIRTQPDMPVERRTALHKTPLCGFCGVIRLGLRASIKTPSTPTRKVCSSSLTRFRVCPDWRRLTPRWVVETKRKPS